jgi:hypothetical protein
MMPTQVSEGDQFIDPATKRIFLYTGQRWIDITSNQGPLEKELLTLHERIAK